MPATFTSVRPAADEHAPYYARYLERVPEGPIVDTLEREGRATVGFLRGISAERGAFRYAPGKWTLREVVGHLVDTEREFATRALHFARGDRQPMPGMEQDDYVANGRFEARTLADLVDEMEALRRANVLLFRSFDEEVLARRGTASGCEFSVRAVLWIIAGHEIHHRGVLREKYLG